MKVLFKRRALAGITQTKPLSSINILIEEKNINV